MAKKKEEAGAIETSNVTAKDLGADQVQAKMDEEQEKGFRGTEVDPTPDENFTVAGVTSGAPTPETDPELARQVGNSRFIHVGEESKKGKK